MAFEIDSKQITVVGGDYIVVWSCKDSGINAKKRGRFVHTPNGSDSHDTIMSAIDSKIASDEGIHTV